MRLLRFGGRGGGSARHEKLFGRDAETCGIYRWLRDNGFPEGFQILCLSCNDSKGAGERCTLAHIDGKVRCYACNEIKLPVKESALTEPPVTGTLAPQHVRRRSRAMRRIDK